MSCHRSESPHPPPLFRARSGYYLRRKWAALRRFVPSYEVKDLPGELLAL